MSKKKFNLTNEFVKIDKNPSQKVLPTTELHKGRYSGPNSNRVAFSTSINPDLKNKFKIWVAKNNSDMSTELEKAIIKIIAD